MRIDINQSYFHSLTHPSENPLPGVRMTRLSLGSRVIFIFISMREALDQFIFLSV